MLLYNSDGYVYIQYTHTHCINFKTCLSPTSYLVKLNDREAKTESEHKLRDYV